MYIIRNKIFQFKIFECIKLLYLVLARILVFFFFVLVIVGITKTFNPKFQISNNLKIEELLFHDIVLV